MSHQTSPAQAAANAANAQLSTGPVTPDGKARSARNATRHGFRSSSVLLPGEDPAPYNDLLDGLQSHFPAQSLAEHRWVREMADAEWRLRRVRALQHQILTAQILHLQTLHPDASPIELQAQAFDALHRPGASSYAQLLRYESKFERQFDKAQRAWTAHQDNQARRQSRQLDIEMKQLFVAPLPPMVPASEPETEICANEPNPPADRILPYRRPAPATPRNAPCPCGSGVKYKRCCGGPDAKTTPATLLSAAS